MTVTSNLEVLSNAPVVQSIPGVVTPASYTPPDDLTIHQAVEVAQYFGALQQFLPWAVGDLLLFAQRHLGEEYSQLAAAFPYAEDTAYRCMQVAEGFSPNQRHEALSWGHHRVVLRFPHPKRERWLTLAEKGGWSVRRLREEVLANRRALPLHQDPEVDAQLKRERDEREQAEEARALEETGGVAIEGDTGLVGQLQAALTRPGEPWSDSRVVALNTLIYRVTVSVAWDPVLPVATHHTQEETP